MDDAQLDFLTKYLSYTTKCFGSIVDGKEAKRLHYIAPILVCVCFLFNEYVEIVAEEDLTGNFMKAHGHFEFMLKQKKKAKEKQKLSVLLKLRWRIFNRACRRTWRVVKLQQKSGSWMSFMGLKPIMCSGFLSVVVMKKWSLTNAQFA
jgi:hypothetical protein